MMNSIAQKLTNDPDKAWKLLKMSQDKKSLELIDPSEPKPADTIRFVILADTHDRHKRVKVADGDVLLMCGDFSYFGNVNLPDFDKFLGKLPHKKKIVIAGNHDRVMYCFEKEKYSFKNCTYLEDSGTDAFGYKIYGTPWVPEYHRGSFMMRRGEELRKKWQKIPTDTDILMTHTPPLGYGDKSNIGTRAGDVDLLLEVQNRIKPVLHAFGHIHEARGAWTDGHTVYVNGSSCTDRYLPVPKSIVVDLPIKQGFEEDTNNCTNRTESETDAKNST